MSVVGPPCARKQGGEPRGLASAIADLRGFVDDKDLREYLAGPPPYFTPVEDRDDAVDTILQVLWGMERMRGGGVGG